MIERLPLLTMLASVTAISTLLAAPVAHAQKIVCWKDKAGKVVGCGDRIPPEYQQNESKTLDRRGITRGTNLSAEEAARQREEDKKKAALQAEEDQRVAAQRRQDAALTNTYTSTREIDQRRERELQVVDLQIQQLRAAEKRSSEAHAAQVARHADYEKRGKVPDNVREDLRRAEDEKKRIAESIADREKDKERISASYAQQKARYIELKGPAATAAAPNSKK